MSDLSRQRITAALSTSWLGRKAYFFQAVGSTNDELRRLAQRGAAEGTLVVADRQTAGRGRQGRRWSAPAGSALLFSVLLRPEWPAAQAPWLTMIAGLAAAAAVEQVGAVSVGLKWPNDVVVDAANGTRKLGGILLEANVAAAPEGDRVTDVVLGIGLNVNMERFDLPDSLLPPTSIRLEQGAAVDRAALLAALLAALEQAYEAARSGVSPHEAWAARLVWRDRPVRITRPDRAAPVAEGRLAGVDAFGQLLIVDAAGRQIAIPSGDLSLRPSD
jgi:BirA family biotin operon repressor/biotin-[acetyl-CoA-carboxylase] ligase